MTVLPPWANGPFELLVHAEGHLRSGGDFDRRIALITFNNAIEVAITTYLTLHPIQRSNRTYQKVTVDKWLENYHTKLDCIEHELKGRGLLWEVERSHIVWAHDNCNEQYHGGRKGTPEQSILSLIRKAALWIFSLLYDITDLEEVLDEAIAATAPPAPPQPDDLFDRAIDNEYGLVTVGEQIYYASEVIFAVDKAAYRDIGGRLCQSAEDSMGAGESR